MGAWGTSWGTAWGEAWNRLVITGDTIRPPMSFEIIGGKASMDITDDSASFAVLSNKASIDIEG